MAKIISFVFCIFSLFVLTACLNDPVKDELLRYVNDDLASIEEQEKEVLTLYADVTGENYTDDETLYIALVDEIIPKYRTFVNDLEAIEVESKELRELHEQYIEGVNLQFEAFSGIISAIEEQDFSKIEEINGKLSEARKMLRDFQFDLKALAKEHNVTLTKDLNYE